MDSVERRRFPFPSERTLGRVMVLPLAVVIRTVNLWPAPTPGITGVKDSPTKQSTDFTVPTATVETTRRAAPSLLAGVRS